MAALRRITSIQTRVLRDGRLVPLQAGNGGFAARNCGFNDEYTGYVYLSLTDLEGMLRGVDWVPNARPVRIPVASV